MSSINIILNRRAFLKLMGWSATGAALAACDLPSTVTLEEGRETVVAYLSPKEYSIPGIGVWYASACTQCASACGIHGRVREGRALKLEGNPGSPINRGKLCQMGQAGIQAHYHPDRLTRPMLKKDGKLAEISWDDAHKLLAEKAGPSAGISANRFAWVTGTVSGHQAVLIASHLEAMGSTSHFVHETVATAVGQAVNRDMLGESLPRLAFDKAKLIVSFGADFLGSWVSPLHFSTEYAKFRAAPRGTLVQIEPKMTLTGANADLWVAIRPGTEGALALGLIHELVKQGARPSGAALTQTLQAAIASHDPAKVSTITGISAERIAQIATLLKDNSPSLVLAGAPVEGHADGYAASAAVMLLNVILGNIGQTVLPGSEFPFPQIAARPGSTRSLLAFAEAAQNKSFDVVFFHSTNPVYTAPAYLKLGESLQSIPFKVAFTQFLDETSTLADLVLPISSSVEDWGTHVPAYQGELSVITLQQPLMERLHGGTLGFGNLLLTMMKSHDLPGYGAWDDYYAYLRQAFASLPANFKGDAVTDDAFWDRTLQTGQLTVAATPRAFQTTLPEITLPEPAAANANYPLYLVPSVQLGLWDGRHANLPWIQEAPDQISKVVWDSWAELHPVTAKKLGIAQGDLVEISSAQGAIKLRAYIFKGVHPDVVAVPMGQGHEHGRYAKGVGVNPLKILDPVVDSKTGELALYATRVKVVASAGDGGLLVREGHDNTSQLGRKLVGTIPAEQFRSTEGA